MENSTKELNLKITLAPDNEIPAFAGYVNYENGCGDEPKIVVNFRAMLLASAEHDLGYKKFFAETVVHEMLHMIQEIFGQTFSEDEVEDALMHARKFLAEEQK